MRSELMRGINQILNVVTWIIAPTAVLLVYSQLRVSPSLADAIRGSVAGVITLVPEGLVLLTSTALALAVIRLGRRKVLIQQLPAVEILARTDVICLDKTGTLTERDVSVACVEPLSTGDDWEQALCAIAWADPQPHPSLKAIAASYPQPADWQLESTVPFPRNANGARQSSATAVGGCSARRTCCCLSSAGAANSESGHPGRATEACSWRGPALSTDKGFRV